MVGQVFRPNVGCGDDGMDAVARAKQEPEPSSANRIDREKTRLMRFVPHRILRVYDQT